MPEDFSELMLYFLVQNSVHTYLERQILGFKIFPNFCYIFLVQNSVYWESIIGLGNFSEFVLYFLVQNSV